MKSVLLFAGLTEVAASLLVTGGFDKASTQLFKQAAWPPVPVEPMSPPQTEQINNWDPVSLVQVIIAEDNACTTATPDFSAPHRRLSEQMCRTYNWERKNLEKCSTAQDIEVNEHPYMGAIGFKSNDKDVPGWRFLCAAFLVSPKFAVTAAHCGRSAHENLQADIIRFGNKNIEVPRIDVKIIKKIPHPSHITPKKRYDIALFELEHALPLSRAVMPACLWTQPEVSSNDVGEVSAWATSKGEVDIPDTIKTMRVRPLDSETCLPLVKTRYTRLWRQLEDHQLCVNDTSYPVHLCHGSAGAPLISSVALDGEDKMPYAQGVVSFGFSCDPDIIILTKISSFVDWIEETVWAGQPL